MPTSRFALPVLLTSTFMQLLDTSVVNVVAQQIGSGLRASDGQLVLVSTGYTAAFAALLIPAVPIGRRWGQRRVLIGGTAIFTVASAACAVAQGPGALIVARFAQGMGAGLMAPQVLAIIAALWSGHSYRVAIARYGATMGVASVIGPVIGSVLSVADVAGLGWRAVFAVNVPIGVVLICAARKVLPPPDDTVPLRSPNWWSAAVVVVGAGLLVVSLGGLHDAATAPRSWVGVTVGGALTIVALARRGGTGHERLVDPALLRDRPFAQAIVATALFFLGATCFFFLFSQWLQVVRGLSPFDAAMYQIPWALGAVVGSTIIGRLPSVRYGASLGCAVVLAALGAVAGLVGAPTLLALIPVLAFGGVGFGVFVATAFAGATATLHGRLRTDGAALLPAVQQLAASVGLSCAGLIFYPGSALIATLTRYSVPVLAVALLAWLYTERRRTMGDSTTETRDYCDANGSAR